jgi:hypothetical protein
MGWSSATFCSMRGSTLERSNPGHRSRLHLINCREITMTVATARLARRIQRFKAKAVHFRKLARHRHKRAAYWTRRSHALRRQGFIGRAAIALRNAMRFKKLAARATLHATFYGRRSVAARKIRMRRIRTLRVRMLRAVRRRRAARVLRAVRRRRAVRMLGAARRRRAARMLRGAK